MAEVCTEKACAFVTSVVGTGYLNKLTLVK